MRLMLCALSVGAAQAAWLCTQKVHALRLMHHVWYAHSNAAHLLQGGRLEKGTRRAAGTGSSLEHPGISRQPFALPAGHPPSAATAYQAMIALHGTLPLSCTVNAGELACRNSQLDFLPASGSPLRSPQDTPSASG